MKDGLLLIDKHAGCTSHDVVAATRRVLRIKKIGHCGTLDPAATGLLLLTVGRATRLTRFLIQAPKVYEGLARLGVTTDTYDTSGEVTATADCAEVSEETLFEAMESFVGHQLQRPPPYCAKKVGGVKYYELARRGEATPDEKKEVHIFEFQPLGAWRPGEDLPFRLGCSSGTYVRSLVHDLGEKIGCGGTLAALRRTRVGGFNVDDAIGIEALREKLDAAESADLATVAGGAWIPFDDVPLPFGEIVADAQQERRIRHGQSVLVQNLEGGEGDWIKVRNQRRQFIAVGSVVERIGTGNVGVVQPKVVFT